MSTEATQTTGASAGTSAGTTQATTSTTSTQAVTDPGKQDGAQSAGKQAGTTAATGTTTATADVELKLPDGFKDEASLGTFKTLMKELGVTSAQAQKLFDTSYQRASQAQKEAEANREKQRSEWKEASKADKEFGGKDFDANIALVRKAIVKFGSPELHKLLDDSGLGDHPELLRAFYRAGKAIAEDSVAGSSSPGAGPMTDEQRWAVMFPNMNKVGLSSP